MPEHFDAVVIGAGAAGMMAAAVAGQRGRRLLLIDHAAKVGEKIRISGGGRCNFTNVNTTPANFLSQNPHFCRSALARYTPRDFIALVQRHRIEFHEKHKGQLFCDGPSEAIIQMLRDECDAGSVQWRTPCRVARVSRESRRFRLELGEGEPETAGAREIVTDKLVIATGGLSIPKIGATDFGYRIARQFGMKIIEPCPALVPLTFALEEWTPFVALAGVALEVEIKAGPPASPRSTFREDLLFTHRGLSGPAVLQISSFWNPGEALTIDLAPAVDLAGELTRAKLGSGLTLANVLARWLPKSLVHAWLSARQPDGAAVGTRKLAEIPDKAVRNIAASLKNWTITPSGTEGFRKAEVTRGGVDTRELSQQTMESLVVAGLYFIGEVVDVTGWLGGYNFQWAWASGAAAGRAL